MDFIPAQESAFITWFFDWYTRLLMRLRFKHVWLKQHYTPDENSRTVYFLNHNSWWDGLIPLFLNQKFFKQKARAIMEAKQIHQYSFFSRIGAFSINPEEPKSSMKSLRYALESMERPKSSLFIYPEGKIVHSSESKPKFKEGLAWLYTKTENVDFVPVALQIHTLRHSKPELYICIGKLVNHDKSLSRNELNELLEEDLHRLIRQTREVAGSSDEGFFQIF